MDERQQGSYSRESLDSVESEASIEVQLKEAKRVFLGGGAEAGAWAAELVRLGGAQGALIISDQPPGAAPYDRLRGTTGALLDHIATNSLDNLPLCIFTASSPFV